MGIYMNKKLLLLTVLTVGTVVGNPDNKPKSNSSSSSASSKKITDLSSQELERCKICFIDSFEAMGKCSPGQVCSVRLENLRKQLSEALGKDQQNIEQKIKDFQAKAPTMSEVSRTAEEKNFRQLEANYKVKLQESELEMKSTIQKETENLAVEMREAVAEICKGQNIIVIDKATGQVIYSPDNLDITQVVIETMNTKHNEKLAANKKSQPNNEKLATNKKSSTGANA